MRNTFKKIFNKLLSSSLFTSESTVAVFFRKIVYLFLLNKVGKASVRHLHGFLWRCKFNISSSDNEINVHDHALLFNCKIEIRGEKNSLMIGKDCIFQSVSFCLRDTGSSISIGNRTQGRLDSFVAMEGKRVDVGEGSLFSYNVEIRNTDSHSILNEAGNRTNPAVDVFIGNHVWVAQDCLLLKGTYLAGNSIVGAKSLVNKRFEETGSLIAGTPAKILKSGFDWTEKRI